MTLTLSIEGASRLENGAPAELVLNRRGAIVGRASTCDWALPDPSRHVSSRHFEIRYDECGYVLTDRSTNGTTLAGNGQKLSAPHPIKDGDRFQVGPYVIRARLTGEAARAAETPAPAPPAWRGWDDCAPPPSPVSHGISPSDPHSDWDTSPIRGDTGVRWQPQLGPSLARPDTHRPASGWESRPSPAPAAPAGWAPNAAAAPPPVASAWEALTPASDPASRWSSAAPDRPAAASPDDLWGRIAEGNVVDWARGGFGQPVEAPGDPLGLTPPTAETSLPAERPRALQSAPPAPPTRTAESGTFFESLGIDASRLGDSNRALARAALLLRSLVAGLVVMLEARARAKSQLGAEATAYNPDGHNPLKFARAPDDALLMLLGAAQPGFMEGEAAIEDAFKDLQSHQVATLKAMQGALRTTLERFSPAAIRARADAAGMIERILPAAREAALWQAYEREFGGVAQGSDEAFLDMFAKEFRQAYNAQARRERP